MWLSRNRILDTRVLHQLMEDSNRVSLVKTLLLESNGVLRNYHLGGFIQDRTSIYWCSFKKHPLKHSDKTLNR